MLANSEKLQGLFINTAKANCSIYESGKMCFNCLVISDKYTLDYIEVEKHRRCITLTYDFYIFNYHNITMGWLDTAFVKKIPGLKFTIVLETLPNNPFVYCSKESFDGFLVLDPTINVLEKNVYSFTRPIEEDENDNEDINQENETPLIGTFGFATIGKGFEDVIKAVNNEFDKATIRINIPTGDYVNDKDMLALKEFLEKCNRKLGISLQITHHFFDKKSLIKWCKENTLNVFLYSRNMPGLSATTDQAITSGRPLAISTDYTFRHIHPYIKPYPFRSLKESILLSKSEVEILKKEWSKDTFMRKFETVLSLHHTIRITKTGKKIKLKTINNSNIFKKIHITDFSPPIFQKIFRKIKNKYIKSTDNYKQLTPFFHPVLHSYSQFNEDLLIDLFLGSKVEGFYIDVGANHPIINSNTKRFYQRGWKGINIEPDPNAFEIIKYNRNRDINLNIAISEDEKLLNFYQLGDDSTLSTLDHETAENMSRRLNLPIVTSSTNSLPLVKVLDKNLQVNQHIDFISIDAEGHDLSVIRSNDWSKYRPSIIIIESNYQFEEIRNFLDKKDYLHVYNNNYNAIFINKLTNDKEILNKINWTNNN